MALTFQEEIALRAAFMEIQRERKQSLRAMFEGTRLVRKSKLEDAKEVVKEAKKAKKIVDQIPGVKAPDLDNPFGNLNLNLLKGIDLKKLINLHIPSLSLPGWDLDLIPDIKIGDLPGINLPSIKLNLKEFLNTSTCFRTSP